MNHLQSDNDYRENLIRAYRMSGSGPDAENWKTCAFRFWRMPLGLKSRCVPSAVILPSKKIMYENAELDLFAESNKFFYSNSSYRRNRYGLPAFCMWIDMEKFTDCILQGPPNG